MIYTGEETSFLVPQGSKTPPLVFFDDQPHDEPMSIIKDLYETSMAILPGGN
jgi:hypothetical protein